VIDCISVKKYNVFIFIIPSDKAFAEHLYFVMIVPRIKYLIKRDLFDYTQKHI
jgi:hypothetical protein